MIGQGKVRGMGGSSLEGVGEHGSRRKLADWGENKYGKKGSNSSKAPSKVENEAVVSMSFTAYASLQAERKGNGEAKR